MIPIRMILPIARSALPPRRAPYDGGETKLASSAIAMPSERRVRFLEERDLLWRRFAAEYRVAVGKAPEAHDDLLMAQGVLHRIEGALALGSAMFLGPAPEEGNRTDLILGILAMLERQVEEAPSIESRAPIKTAVDGRSGRGSGAYIAGKGSQRSAMDVAWELVEQQHERERAVDRAHPIVEIADARGG